MPTTNNIQYQNPTSPNWALDSVVVNAGSSPETVREIVCVGDSSGNITTINSTTTTSKYAVDVNILSIDGVLATTSASGIIQVGLADGAGNKLTTNSTTTSAKTALDINLLSVDGVLAVTAASGIIKAGVTDSAGNSIYSVAKGTQATSAVGVQNLKDSGRSILVLTTTALASSTTTTVTVLTALVQNSNYSSSTGVTSFQVPAGKTLRLQSMAAAAVAASTNATVANEQCVYIDVRVSTTNTTTALGTAPIAYTLPIPITTANTTTTTLSFILQAQQNDANFPDGIEIPASDYVGITIHNAITNIATIVQSITLVGYTY